MVDAQIMPKPVASDVTTKMRRLLEERKNAVASWLEQISKATSKDNLNPQESEIYNIRLRELQSMIAQIHMLEDSAEIEIMKLQGRDFNDDELEALLGRYNMSQLVWAKLNDDVIKALARINDREKRTDPNARQQLTIQQYTIIMRDAEKLLLEHEGKP